MHYNIYIAYRYKIHTKYTNIQSLGRKGVGVPFPSINTEESTGYN